MSKEKVAAKASSIGVSNALAKRYLDGKLTAPQKAMMERLLVAGVREPFALRAIERGITDEDILWNQRLGRPIAFMETVHPEVEVERREDWLRTHPGAP